MKKNVKVREDGDRHYEVWREDAWRVIGRRYPTPEAARQAGIRYRRKHGCNERYVVVCVEWRRRMTEDGKFLEQHTSKYVVPMPGCETEI